MSPDAAAPHVPVLLDEVIAALAVVPGETHVDGTFGAGGYTKAILDKGAARVFAFDRDPEAIRYGETLAASSGGRLALVPERFSRMRQALAARQVDAVDGVTLDIGVSSMQLDRPERGFSFQADGPLDMRMGKEGESAADFLNRADEEEKGASPDDHYDRARRLFGMTEDVPYDPSGRIVLPPMMRRKGKIEDLALFVGIGGVVEVWNPRIALKEGGSDLREIAAYRLEEKGIAP